MASPNGTPDHNTRWPRPLLRRFDQAVIAVILGLSLTAIAISLISRGAHRGNLIEIDRAEQQTFKFQIDINDAQWSVCESLDSGY